MFDTWSKNNEQKCWADLHMRLHPGSFSSDLLSWYSYNLQRSRGSAFLMMQYGKGAGNTDKGKHLKPTSHTNTLFSTTTKQKNWNKKKLQKNMVMLFTQLSLTFLDLNYKHTSILQLHICPTYSVPFDCYSLLPLKNLALVLTVL